MHTAHLDPRIGVLNSGRFYAFVNGYDRPEFTGTREEVEVALGIRIARTACVASKQIASRLWTVTLRFKHPAWDEVDGIVYAGIPAASKSDAVRSARVLATSDGHVTGRGRHWFSATLEGEQ